MEVTAFSDEATLFFFGSVILMALSLIFRRSMGLYLIQLAWLILISGCNTDSQDYPINKGLYEAARDTDMFSQGVLGWLYDITVHVSIDMGWSFQTYNFLMSAFSIGLLGYVIHKYTKNYNIVLLLVFFYPFPEMIIQKRFLPGMAVMVYFTQFLGWNTWKGYALYTFGLFAAVGLHSSLIFFVVFLMLALFHNYKPKTFRYAYPVIALICFIGVNFIPTIAGLFFPADKVELYFVTFAEKLTLLKSSCWAIAHMSMVLVAWYVHKHQPKTPFGELVYYLNVYSILIIPLYYFDSVFVRYFRIVLMYDYMYLADFFLVQRVMPRSRLVASLGVVGIAATYFFTFYCLGVGNQTFARMVAPMYQCNLLVEFIQ